jgi:hypothetical protein
MERKTGRPTQFHHKDTKVTELRLLYKNLLELSQLLELLGLASEQRSTSVLSLFTFHPSILCDYA